MHPVLRTITQRLLLGLLTLFLVSVVIFIGIQFLPGDFAQAILGQAATEETVRALRAELGLDQTPLVRYFDWIMDCYRVISGIPSPVVMPGGMICRVRLWN